MQAATPQSVSSMDQGSSFASIAIRKAAATRANRLRIECTWTLDLARTAATAGNFSHSSRWLPHLGTNCLALRGQRGVVAKPDRPPRVARS